MKPSPFATRAQLERQIDAARQLRAETLATRETWAGLALPLATALRLARRAMSLLGAFVPRSTA